MQSALVEADPERFFVPAYVGHRGWIGVGLDRGFDRDEIAGIVEDPFAEVAPPSLLERADEGGPPRCRASHPDRGSQRGTRRR
jgi:hypothetical protein